MKFYTRLLRHWALISSNVCMEDQLKAYRLKHQTVSRIKQCPNPTQPKKVKNLKNNQNHTVVENKGEFRSRPISAFVYIFALSQSECVKRFIT
jgi:hypothetical protein